MLFHNHFLRPLLQRAFKQGKRYSKKFVVHHSYKHRSRLKPQGLEKKKNKRNFNKKVSDVKQQCLYLKGGMLIHASE